MPMNRAQYPDNWETISSRIRFERAGGRCECTGECGADHGGRCNAPHGETVWRREDARHIWRLPDAETPPVGWYAVRVVLTTAHLDHDRGNNDEANLLALCQHCHLRHDRRTLKALRRQRAIEAGQMEMDL